MGQIEQIRAWQDDAYRRQVLGPPPSHAVRKGVEVGLATAGLLALGKHLANQTSQLTYEQQEQGYSAPVGDPTTQLVLGVLWWCARVGIGLLALVGAVSILYIMLS